MKLKQVMNATVIVAALGYFVDMYDLSLFGIVRISSLKALGYTDPKDLLRFGAMLYNYQMSGMIVGGIFWGILGDKRGRLTVLFGSILLYSLANIANAFVTNIETYAALRFIAGVGLAGELGAAITLVAESLPKDIRGYGTTIVATLGLCGSAAAALVGDFFPWQTAYIIGGVMGLLLLAARFKMSESGMFSSHNNASNHHKGDVRLLLQPSRLKKYLCCILIGVPIWFITGVLVTFSPEFSRALNVQGGEISVGHAVLAVSIGLALGDLASGILSQLLESRKKALMIFILFTMVLAMIYLGIPGLSSNIFYALCFLMGIGAGYWAVFVTVASEQFGTNLRSTVTTTVPNFVRGFLVLINISFSYLHISLGWEVVKSASLIGAVLFALALVSLFFLEETFGKNLDYLEQ